MSGKKDGFAIFAAIWTALLGSFFATAVSTQNASTQAAPHADVLSIGGSVTEIVAALDQQHRLKARDTTSVYPPEVVNLPNVGYMRALSPEGVLSVGPELILAEEGSGPPEAIDVIRAANLPFVEVPDSYTAQGIADKITIIGAALDVPDKARELSTQVLADMEAAQQQSARAPDTKKRVLFILSTQGGKINASGVGTAADAIIQMAGGINVIDSFEGYKQISDEAVGAAAPDVILMMDRGGNHGGTNSDLFAMPALQLTPAAETEAVVRMNGLLLLGFGPRTAEAIVQLNTALYGEGS
ncbi:ABC transporter substrate-binding protein [Phaeobacter sp.]|uniref:heme/hemin ABC transporter substrate-binding protein n=1 Tax=Phaeobacter sp. TaxID=1902409 RepID=UPI0025FC5C5C|nr:ABC transporter substrate-binding protein [Phaeobacter sp.]